MSAPNKYTVNPNVIGRALVEEYGLSTVTKLFNAYRALHDTGSVQPQTVARYNNGGGRYDTNTASLYHNFLRSRLRKSS